MPPGFAYPIVQELWVALAVNPALEGKDTRATVEIIGRLRDDVSRDQASAELATIAAQVAELDPKRRTGITVEVKPYVEEFIGTETVQLLSVMLAAVLLVLVIACVNVANLVLARAADRTREVAVRTALGARRGRLLRQFTIEGLLLSLVAAALSLPLAWSGLQAIAAISPEAVFRQLRIDLHEVSFVALLALVCPLVYSLAPARLIARPDMRQVLASQGGRGTTASVRGRGALVVAQVALAVILLTASTLAFKSIRGAFSAPLGMDTARSLIFGVEFNDAIYPEPAQADAAMSAATEALSRVPGVNLVSMVDALPVLGDRAPSTLTIDGVVPERGDAKPLAVVTAFGPDAGEALGIELLAGAWWTRGVTDAAVISRATAERYFGGIETAIGRRVTVGETASASYRIVGVSDDVANTNRSDAAPPRMWVPLTPGTRRVTFVITGPSPASLGPGVRSAAAATFPSVPLDSMSTFADEMRRAESSDYAVIFILAAFAVLAMVLAITGLFGVVSYSVAQRTPEFGTRIALGATAATVVGLVARQSMSLLAIGLMLGLAGGVTVAFGMQNILFGVSPTDPATLVSVTGLLLVVAVLATALPAWRASRVDPVIALRAD
jgi:putative ABC transport system permease protein